MQHIFPTHDATAESKLDADQQSLNDDSPRSVDDGVQTNDSRKGSVQSYHDRKGSVQSNDGRKGSVVQTNYDRKGSDIVEDMGQSSSDDKVDVKSINDGGMVESMSGNEVNSNEVENVTKESRVDFDITEESGDVNDEVEQINNEEAQVYNNPVYNNSDSDSTTAKTVLQKADDVESLDDENMEIEDVSDE